MSTVEICYLDRGSQTFQIEEQVYHLGGGEVLVTLPDEPYSSAGQSSEPCVLYWLNVGMPRPGRRLLALPAKESDSLIHALHALPRRHFPGGPLLKTLFDRLLTLHGHPEIALQPFRIRHALLQLLLEIIDRATCHARSSPSPLAADVLRVLQTRPTEAFRLEDLARHVGLSVAWFKSRFKHETGVSPRQFILRTKVEMARQRLAVGRDKITQIAVDLGFPTSQYFATVFRRFTGVSPRAYRAEATLPHAPSRRREDGQG